MTDTASRVRTAYDEWAETYDADENPTRDLNARVLRSAGLPLSGRRVLEIGCGTGLNTEYLAREAEQVVAVDISPKMLDKARLRVDDERVRFTADDINQEWAFGDSSFDVVVANLVLEHVDILTHVFAEAKRVLRPGGLFYIGELHPFKQLRGSQARFERAGTGEKVLVAAFQHSVSEYISEGIAAGFTLRALHEWKNDTDEIPRLLTLLFERDDGRPHDASAPHAD